jgi:hypothetical protein
MMSNTKISEYRKLLRETIDEIDNLAFKCAQVDPLIQGVPGEVFRTCGNKNCKCASAVSERHGPYLVIQVYKNKKQRQVAVKNADKKIWQRAKDYQEQVKTLLQLKKTCVRLTNTVKTILKERVEDWP